MECSNRNSSYTVRTVSPALRRAGSVGIVAGVVGFWALELPAMALYPGGTWWDAHARGHRFWQNFLCDLEWRVALDGAPNPLGSRLATAAMLVLVASFAPLWLALPALFPAYPRLGRAVVALGLPSAGLTVATVFMPSERFGAWHGVMVVAASLPGLGAAGLSLVALAIAEPRPRFAAALGAAFWAAALADLALYVHHLAAHVEGTPLIVVVEKVALFLLVAWMLTVAVRVWPR